MEAIKTLTLTGYKIEYVDLREPKPRQHYIETTAYDSDFITSVSTIGADLPDIIRAKYQNRGYHIITIEKLKKQLVNVSLTKLYREAINNPIDLD